MLTPRLPLLPQTSQRHEARLGLSLAATAGYLDALQQLQVQNDVRTPVASLARPNLGVSGVCTSGRALTFF